MAYKHGMWKSKEWNSWDHIKSRCLNENDPKYPDYGGRGITITERWLGEEGFINFFKDMGYAPSKKHTIDRIEVNGNYEKDNCRWALMDVQSNNTRRNVILDGFGKRQTLSQWMHEYNVKYSTLCGRLSRGWTLEKSLTVPANKNFRNRNAQ